ncbi:hypothetical protein D9615_007345 [Tricholomella constricta]|uniref:CCHC-type domain-containing protein n=1 Tax=Tricholomella constricta TaxID=117010 RepID=A0A8H5H5B9_9AGAR|nr:hypothetical protein D9615_007345 [Tricholomella constricta]
MIKKRLEITEGKAYSRATVPEMQKVLEAGREVFADDAFDADEGRGRTKKKGKGRKIETDSEDSSDNNDSESDDSDAESSSSDDSSSDDDRRGRKRKKKGNGRREVKTRVVPVKEMGRKEELDEIEELSRRMHGMKVNEAAYTAAYMRLATLSPIAVQHVPSPWAMTANVVAAAPIYNQLPQQQVLQSSYQSFPPPVPPQYPYQQPHQQQWNQGNPQRGFAGGMHGGQGQGGHIHGGGGPGGQGGGGYGGSGHGQGAPHDANCQCHFCREMGHRSRDCRMAAEYCRRGQIRWIPPGIYVWADTGVHIPYYMNGVRGAVEERFGPLGPPVHVQPQPAAQAPAPAPPQVATGNFAQCYIPEVESHAVIQEVEEVLERQGSGEENGGSGGEQVEGDASGRGRDRVDDADTDKEWMVWSAIEELEGEEAEVAYAGDVQSVARAV